MFACVNQCHCCQGRPTTTLLPPCSGVFSTPNATMARDQLRRSWVWDAQDTPGVLVRFVIDATGASPTVLKSLQAESEAHGDVFLLGLEPG